MGHRPVTGGTDSNSKYTWFCRECGYYEKSVDVPQICPQCGNIEVDEGWGCSGDATNSSNTTVTRTKNCASFKMVGTFDKRRR